MKTNIIVRLSCLSIAWIMLCYLMISSRGLTPWSIFVIIISGGIVFIPLYKKYFGNGK